MKLLNVYVSKVFIVIFLIFLSGHSLYAQLLKSVVYDFDGLDVNNSDLPEGDYSVNDLTYKVAANPLPVADIIGDRVLQLNLNWNTNYGAFGRGISRYIEFDINKDVFNFYFYNPLSNNQNATFDVILTDDDNQSNTFEFTADDVWKKSIVIPPSTGWQLYSIPLKDFRDENPGGNAILDMAFTQNKGMLLMVEFRFTKQFSNLSNPVFYLDMINFSDGTFPTGASVLELPDKSPLDYCFLGAYQFETKGQEYKIPGDVESLFPSGQGKKIKYANYFIHFSDDGTSVAKNKPGNEVQTLINNGYTPIITWEPMFKSYDRLDSRQPRLNNIINGDYNAYIDEFADKIKTYTDTVIIRFMHEFEGDWYSWSLSQNNQDPIRYITAFRKVVDRFRARNVNNVKWMWCVNGDYAPYLSYNWIVPAYPGDNYVDIVATDIYNNHYPTAVPWWQSFKTKAAESYYYLIKYFPQKPLFICELGCRERFSTENSASESKGAWFARMDKEFQTNFNKARALIFFNGAPDQNWLLNSSPSALQSLTDNVWNDLYYFGPPTGPFPISVNISSPSNNSSFNAGTTITIQATVFGGSGSIQKVEFFADSIKLGEDLTSPYSFTWPNVTGGNFKLTAKATDSFNNTCLSSEIKIAVIIPEILCSGTGSISREVWNDISGTFVSSIPISTSPNSMGQMSIFQAPENVGENYGQRISGYICPPLTGNYIFWIASDDNSELWLSTDGNPANKQKIASVVGWTFSKEWTKYLSQQSVAINLTAGQKYYIEALHKEGDQGDHLEVGWQLPNGNFERPIPGFRLSPFFTLPPGTPVNYNPNSFAIIGDFGISGPDEAAVANMVKSWNPEYIITTGDNNYYDGAASTIDANIGQYYHDYIKPYIGAYGAGADINRFFPCLGNHDMMTAEGAPYLQYFELPGNERYYDFIKGNIHFFAINSDNSEVDGTSGSSVQATWLKNKLAAATEKWKIVYFHESPYVSDTTHGSNLMMQWPFKEWGADAVITGHSHIYERVIKDNFPYFINGLGGAEKYSFNSAPISGSHIRYNENFGALQVTVRPDTLCFKFYTIANNLIDSFPIIKPSLTSSLAVNITSPANNSPFNVGTSITIQASTSGGTGTVQKIEFFAGTTKLGERLISPYNFTWNNATAGSYAITAKVTDSGNNTTVSSIVNVAVISCNASGTILREVWNNLNGSLISSIPTSTAPNSKTQLSIFEAPENVADNYGQRISGYICPPITGNYIFWIASDENGELWLSTNNNPANKQKIASVSNKTLSRQWTKTPSQQSAAIYLTMGKQYYIEALHKEVKQQDNLAVGWQLPNGTQERPIPGSRLSPFDNLLSSSIVSPANNSSFNAGSSISIQAAISGGTGTIQKVEFFAGATKLGESLFSPYNFTWNNVTVGNYALTAKATDSGNNTAVSAIINIAVINSPAVTITSPAYNTSYPSPANITINTTATSNGGTIAKIEFYQGSTKIGEDLTAPYSFTWMDVTAGSYVLKAIATDNIGQTGTSQEVNIVVTTCSTPIITPSGPTTMCSGSVTLQANTGSGYIYQWKKDGVNITDATNSYYTAFASGDYQVKIIQGSCISWSAPATVKIQSGLRASITPGGSTTFCTGGNVKLFANTCSDYTYQWKKDGLSISGATGATYTATIEGNYQLQVTQAGLNAWSALVTVTVNACRESDGNSNAELNALAAISEITGLSPIFQMQVFPNPNTGLFTILFNMPLTKEEKVKMRIVNLLGQEVYNKEYVTKDNYIKEVVELDKSFPSGIYKLEVMVGNKVENTSVVLSR